MIDLTGKRFGKLVAISKAESRKGQTFWLCKCDCGNEKVVNSACLRGGTIKSCGCLRKTYPEPVKGKKYGMLTFTGVIYSEKGRRTALFDCDCGKKNVKISLYSVMKEHQKSCGCIIHNKFGLPTKSYARLNNILQGMRHRCLDENDPAYSNYGGRNITICKDWAESVEKFVRWAIQNGYSDTLSIDRIDNNKGYCPENCRWSTRKEQMRNTRQNIMFEHNGKKKCMMEWCNEIGIPHYLACNRYKRGYRDFETVFYPGYLRERGILYDIC